MKLGLPSLSVMKTGKSVLMQIPVLFWLDFTGPIIYHWKDLGRKVILQYF